MAESARNILSEKDIVEVVIDYVFRERSAADLAVIYGMSSQAIRYRIRKFGIQVRSSAEQRRCDTLHGRYEHAMAIRNAWRRGNYNTEAVRQVQQTWNRYDRHGESNPFFGKKHTKETLSKLASFANDRVIIGVGEYGDDWTAELRDRIVTRDSNRCQICGNSKCKLQVHHLDLDRTNNNESNLLTVCAACHLAYHGRRELQSEMQAAQSSLITRLGFVNEASP